VVKRINHLEATNVQLREEAEKYRSERNAYKLQLEEESNATIAEKEAALMRAETDLARIRNTRDELFADQQIRKNAQDQEKTAGAKLQELADAREARIAALESEIERLRLQIEGPKTAENVDDIPLEELRSKYTSLERQYSMLNTELASMQTAYKKFSTLASQKVTDFGALEEKVARLTAEKSKADQKYFAAMKSKEARDVEVRTLRMQNSKTSDIVSQLKESEAATRSLISNMDKQVSETKEALNSALEKHRVTQQQLTESNIVVEGLRNQVAELKNISTSKDATLGNTSTALRQAETEIAGLKQSLSDTKKSLDNWKNKSLGNNSSEYEMLRVSLHLATTPFKSARLTFILDACTMHSLPPQLQKHRHQNMRSCLLQGLRRGASHLAVPQMSQLQPVLRQQRPHAHHLVIFPSSPSKFSSCIIPTLSFLYLSSFFLFRCPRLPPFPSF
jgi:E3 ubiquitin-protein ligase BRE1